MKTPHPPAKRRSTRREWLGGVGACLAMPAGAALARPALNPKRLQNRLELWSNYARRTTNLMTRLVTIRDTSLLDQPLVTTGALAFSAPSTLVLRDDGLSGSSTLVDEGLVVVVPNQAKFEDTPVDPSAALDRALQPAREWLAGLLLRLFRPPQADASERELLGEDRVAVPRKGFRLELMPPHGSVVRQTFRTVTVHLDPVVGAVTQVVIAHTQGDRLRLRLTDHRQNIDAADIDAVINTVRRGHAGLALPSEGSTKLEQSRPRR